jgi:hypothetical protein
MWTDQKRKAIICVYVIFIFCLMSGICYSNNLVESAKKALTERGYYAETIDSKWTDSIRKAIKQYQEDNNLKQTGRLTEATLQSLGLSHPSKSPVKKQTTKKSDSSGSASAIQIDFGLLKNGDLVSHRQNLSGYSNNPGNSTLMWVVVVPHAVGNYHPQGRSIKLRSSSGTWSLKPYIGASKYDNIGELFDILLVNVTEVGSTEFTNYLNKSARDKDWPGMDDLPNGSVILKKVFVKRR